MIKKVILILVLFASKTFAQTPLDAVIMGSVQNATSKYIELKYLNNPIDDTLQTMIIELNEQGQFYQALPLRKPLEAILVYNQNPISIFIEPEENVEIRTSEKHF